MNSDVTVTSFGESLDTTKIWTSFDYRILTDCIGRSGDLPFEIKVIEADIKKDLLGEFLFPYMKKENQKRLNTTLRRYILTKMYEMKALNTIWRK